MAIIGRLHELDLLSRMLAAAESGAGGVALIEGEAGIGKSRLLEEVALRSPASVVLRGRAWEEGGAPSLWPWREVVGQLGGGVDWASAADRFDTYARVATVVREASKRASIVILLDDLHAADEDTLALTRYVGRAIRDVAVAIVAAGRPTTALQGIARDAVLVVLEPLAANEIGDLVEGAAPVPISTQARDEIIRLSEGVPLIAHELALVANAQPSPRAPLPGRVRDVVLERVNPLPSEARELLDAAAVLGRSFSASDLAALVDDTRVAVVDRLSSLVTAHLVDEQPDTWRFAHQVIRDVLYESLPVRRRQELHAVAADVAASAPNERLEGRARHLLAAVPFVDPILAIDSATAAAAALSKSGNHNLAAETLTRAINVCDDALTRLDLLLRRGEALLRSGRVEEGCRTFDQAFSLANEVGDVTARTRALLGRTELVPSTPQAAALAGLIGGSLPNAANASEHMQLLARYARLLSVAGSVPDALAASLDAAEAAREIGDDGLLCDALNVRHYTLGGPDDLVTAREVGRELGAAAERLADRDWLFEAEMAQLEDGLRAGDIGEVDRRLARCHEIAGGSGRQRHWFFFESRRAMRAFLAGRLSEGAAALDRARKIGADIEEPDTEYVFHGARTMVLTELVGRDEARRDAEEAEALAAMTGEPRLLLFAAYLRSSAGDLVEAAELVDRAVLPDFSDLARDRSWLMLMAMSSYAVARSGHARRASAAYDLLVPYRGIVVVNDGAVTFGGVVDHYLGLLAAALGRPLDARTHLDAAVEQYERMGAALFLARARQDGEQIVAQSFAAVTIAQPRSARLERRDGEWTCGYGDATFHLRHMVGLQHLATLVEADGAEVHALQLAGGGAEASHELRIEVLDPKAKAAYRERITGLREDIEEADANNDYERVDHLQSELDAIIEHLRVSVGLGGASRTAATNTERARVAVRKAITAAIDRLAERDEAFAQHLRLHIRTGTYCRYESDPLHPIAWVTPRSFS